MKDPVRLVSVVFILLSTLVLLGACSGGESLEGAPDRLELAVPFTDNMILQRSEPVAVWGFAPPGERVTVEFAGQKKTAKADRRGDWRVTLEPLAGSAEGREFTVTAASKPEEPIQLADVLVGEVWFSSGQSNMVWIAGKSSVRELAMELSRAEEDIPIREISINTVSALYPQKRATSDGGWKKIKDASGFSALSLAFAHELYQELNVPIGILLSAHSNTRIEAFTQREAIEAHPDLAGDVKLMHDADPRLEQGRAAFEQVYRDIRAWQEEAGPLAEQAVEFPDPPALPGIAGMWRGPSQFYNGKIHPVIPYTIRGAIWCQGTSNSEDGKRYAARMEALVNGWREAWDMPEMPFYFTQMQPYGPGPDPDKVGFADLRQAQHLFFINNRENVGMVVQVDHNPSHPNAIHYSNKLHPGMRMARWALAHDYGRDIPFTGPIFQSAEVRDDTMVVTFESGSLFGGLMVGSKGMEADMREPGQYVEPARPTPDANLNHFRLCGTDRRWHAAEAVIAGDTVEVRSPKVPEPVGVQYAYSAVPMNANLYNRAGLPATPFAVINGEFIFEEDDPEVIAAEKAREARRNDDSRPFLLVAAYYRDGAVVQRDRPVHVWGFANAGADITVTLGGVTEKTVANELEQWSVRLPAFEASKVPKTLKVETSMGSGRTIEDILVGDVWYLTGGRALTEKKPYDPRDENALMPEPLPLVREFLKRSNASTHPRPRKRYFEIGGGRFSATWAPAQFTGDRQEVSDFVYHFAKALDRPGIPQGFITMSSGRDGRPPVYASPLSWTSFAGVKGVENPAFEERMKELMLQYPGSKVARAAVEEYLAEVKGLVEKIIDLDEQEADLAHVAPLGFPPFPKPGQELLKANTVPTYTYNWCVSPLTPMAVSGVIWVPESYNIGENPGEYAIELEIYARSLPETYGQENVPFYFAQPSAELVEGITEPDVPGARYVTFDEWPADLKAIAIALAEQVE